MTDSDMPSLAISRRTLLAAAGLIGISGLTRFGAAHAATQLTWMGWQGYDSPLKQGSFLADNGIELAATFIANNEEIITKLQAGGGIDLATIYFGHVPILIAGDLIEPIDESKVPEIGKVFPHFIEVDAIRKDGQLHAIPFTWGTLPMVYDPAVITTPPTSWSDCLKDEYKGKVAITDDISGLISTWAPIATGTRTPTRLTPTELRETIDLLIKIKKEHARTFSPDYGEATDLFARGEVVISAIGWDAQVGFAAAKGKTLAYVLPEEGAMAYMDTLVIPKTSANKELAYKALAHAISPEAQAVLAAELTQAVVNSDAVKLVDDSNRAIYQYDNLDKLLERARFNPFWPLESDGTHATFQEVQDEYQRFLQA
ncbi:MAG: extracellular solute-binding protein [Gemmobacter sp.]|jgi:spermidine/putrescine-binding protein|nr:extracellular solute-binding protein [Gemmobacter sp.]